MAAAGIGQRLIERRHALGEARVHQDGLVGEVGDHDRDADRAAEVADQRPHGGALRAQRRRQRGQRHRVERHEHERRGRSPAGCWSTRWCAPTCRARSRSSSRARRCSSARPTNSSSARVDARHQPARPPAWPTRHADAARAEQQPGIDDGVAHHALQQRAPSAPCVATSSTPHTNMKTRPMTKLRSRKISMEMNGCSRGAASGRGRSRSRRPRRWPSRRSRWNRTSPAARRGRASAAGRRWRC